VIVGEEESDEWGW